MQASIVACAALVAVCVLWRHRRDAGSKEAFPVAAATRLLRVLQKEELVMTIWPGMGAGGKHAKPDPLFQLSFGPNQSVVARFQVKFDTGFEWGCRGKVGGLFVGTGDASGGHSSEHGASARLMWDGPTRTGYAYVYVPEGSRHMQPQELRVPPPSSDGKETGNHVWRNDPFLVGKFADHNWHDVALGIKLNSFTKGANNRDGALWLQIDGATKLLPGVVWRKRPGIGISKFQVRVFHGGPEGPPKKGGCDSTKTSTLRVRNVQLWSW